MDSFDDRLKIINNSDHNIKFICEMQYETDSIVQQVVNRMANRESAISPKDSSSWLITNQTYEQIIEAEPDKVFRIYIFDADTIYKYSWEVARRENMILKRYEFTLAELTKIDWRVTYP